MKIFALFLHLLNKNKLDIFRSNRYYYILLLYYKIYNYLYIKFEEKQIIKNISQKYVIKNE